MSEKQTQLFGNVEVSTPTHGSHEVDIGILRVVNSVRMDNHDHMVSKDYDEK